jgi:hypothetical protein
MEFGETPPEAQSAETERQLVEILYPAKRLLVDADYAKAKDILASDEVLKGRVLKALYLQIGRCVIRGDDFINPEDETPDMSRAEKASLPYKGYGRSVGQRRRLLKESGYTDADVNSYTEEALKKLSWGGNETSQNVLYAVDAMGLDAETRGMALVTNLIERAFNRDSSFKITGEEDVNVVREALGEKYKETIGVAVGAYLLERSDPEYAHKHGLMERRDNTIAQQAHSKMLERADALGLDQADIEYIEKAIQGAQNSEASVNS